jgi:NAD(P)-dependent dehydrogenase (short-subunit alcohol dehydrogenase family)
MVDRMTGATSEGEAQSSRPQVPAPPLGTVDEIGAAVAYLCSREAAFMIGHALVLDGGIVAS